MARRKRKNNSSVLIGVAILAVATLIVWYGMTKLGWRVHDVPSIASTQRNVAAGDVIDATNEGRKISVSGELSAPAAARDADLGISADAIVLLRNVEMYQWREQCAGDGCQYDVAWTPKPVDSSKFRVAAGHDNPKFPFTSARFSSGPIKLGALTVDPELISEQLVPEKYAVHVTDLPANLAATFRESDGALITGDDPAHPKAGALRVSYRVVPAGQATLNGVQHGQRLSAN